MKYSYIHNRCQKYSSNSTNYILFLVIKSPVIIIIVIWRKHPPFFVLTEAPKT